MIRMISRFHNPGPGVPFALAASILLLSICDVKAWGTADVISQLKANPRSIFVNPHGNPASNAALVSSVRDLVIVDKAALAPTIEALKLASTQEKPAIGAGLGQAALAVVKTDPASAAEIQRAGAETSDQVGSGPGSGGGGASTPTVFNASGLTLSTTNNASINALTSVSP
jgi:hypothetical protein